MRFESDRKFSSDLSEATDPVDKILKDLERAKRKKEEKKSAKRYRKSLRDIAREKKRRLDWQIERSKEKDRRRRAEELRRAHSSSPMVTKQDTDASAIQKHIEHLGSVGSKLLGHAIRTGVKKYEERKKQKAYDAGIEKMRAKIEPELKRKRLPPQKVAGQLSPVIRPGQRARQNPMYKKYEMERRGPTATSESYSYWKEDFLYELGDIRKKKSKNKIKKTEIVDVMRGKNKITINPKITERYSYIQLYLNTLAEDANTTQSMSRATPPITGIILPTVTSKGNQPGKYSADYVKVQNEKLFKGNRKYQFNHELSNTGTIDGDAINPKDEMGYKSTASEAYDPDDETFRQHSKETFTAGPGDKTKKERTSRVLNLMKKMNVDVPKKKKKKKKIVNESKSGDQGLHDWFNKSKSSDGKSGWVQLGGKWAGKPCARQPKQTSTPKCGSSKMKRNLSKKEEETARRRKNRLDPNQPEKTGGASPTNVRTEHFNLYEVKDKPGRGSGEKDACYHKVKSRYRVFPSAYSSGALVKCRKVGASNWGTKSESLENSEKRYCNVCKKTETRNECSYGPEVWDKYSVKESIHEATKREKVSNAILGLSFAASTLQSPNDFVRTGYIESPGVALMQSWARKRGEAERNLDSGRVSHPSRNIKNTKKKIKSVSESRKINKSELMALILKKMFDGKKRKNYLLNYGYIGEAKYDKSDLTCNEPKSDPVGNSLTGKSHVVKACETGREKLIRFGQRGVKGSPKKEGESKAYRNRRKRFYSRHRKNINKGKMSAAYWSAVTKW